MTEAEKLKENLFRKTKTELINISSVFNFQD